MKAWFDGGLHLITGGSHFLFDPSDYYDPHPCPPARTRKPDVVLVSHAHADHANMVESYNNIPKVMHPATRDILSSNKIMFKRVKKTIPLMKKRGVVPGRYDPVEYNGMCIEAFDSGHCIGSVQFKITSGEGSFVFTGDVNLEGSVALKPAEAIPCDHLFIESTMGKSDMIAPVRADSYNAIHDFLKESFDAGNTISVIYGHAIGKGQEITKMLNYFDDLDIQNILVDGRAFYVNKLYEKYELPIGFYREYNKNSFEIPDENTVIYYDLYRMNTGKSTVMKSLGLDAEPPSLITSAFGEKEFNFPIITISSHSDFNGLNLYVRRAIKKESGKVTTFHGSHGEFADHLQSEGYDASDCHETVVG